MLQLLLILLFFTNLASASDYWCRAKHQAGVNNENFDIVISNISDIHYIGFGNWPKAVRLENNGKPIIWKYEYDASQAVLIEEGPYGKDKYRFDFFYFNWLNESNISKQFLPIELHAVFYNNKYDSFEKALRKNFAITVWSFRYTSEMLKKPHTKDNYVDNLYNTLQRVREPGAKLELLFLNFNIPPIVMLMSISHDYFAYQGSLMPFFDFCKTEVLWIEFPTTLEITDAQYSYFCQLLSFNNQSMMLTQVAEHATPSGRVYQNFYETKYAMDNWPEVEKFEYFNATYDKETNGKYNLADDTSKNILFLLTIMMTFF